MRGPSFHVIILLASCNSLLYLLEAALQLQSVIYYYYSIITVLQSFSVLKQILINLFNKFVWPSDKNANEREIRYYS